MEISRLRWWHIAELLPIEDDLFGPERWSAGMFWNELAQGYHYRVALAADGSVAGYAGLAVVPPDEAWVQNLAVRRDAQRHGLGSALLGDLLAEAERNRVRRVMLEVAVDNRPAQQLYARNGFEPLAVRRGYYQPSNTDALVMLREREERAERAPQREPGEHREREERAERAPQREPGEHSEESGQET